MSNEIIAAPKTVLEVIQSAMASPDFKIEQLPVLLQFQKDLMASQAKIAFDEAMARLQPKLPQIHKATKGHNCFYANYETVDAAVRPLYTAEGFSISFDTKGTLYYGTISHREGHSKTVEIDFPLDNSGNKPAIQAKISSLSYAKRNLLQMLLNIVTAGEDDDGATAAGYANISEPACKVVQNLIKETATDEGRFLKVMGVEKVENIKGRDYQKAINLLAAKRAKK